MRVLVAVASKHGSTHGIGEAIAEELRAAGFDTDLRAAEEVTSVEGYDAAILGSAIYMGNWMSEARGMVDRLAPRLVHLPVWLFSSGPIGAGDELKPVGEPAGVAPIVAATKARAHHVFAGKLDKDELGFAERTVSRIIHAPEGDFRDWEAIRAWAREIADALRPVAVA